MLDLESLRLNSAPDWYQCESIWHWAPPALPDYDLWFVAAGQGELRLNNAVFALQPNTCFVIRPGARPLGSHDPRHPLQVFYCHFSLPEALGNESLWPDAAQVRDVDFFVASAHRAHHLWRRGGDGAREQARRCVQMMLVQLADEATMAPPARGEGELGALAAQIRLRPGQKWELDAMARAVHLSRAQFVRRFRASFDQSPAQFVIAARLNRARQLMVETNLSLEQIARALGYANAAFFTRQFREQAGQTPTQWRRGRR